MLSTNVGTLIRLHGVKVFDRVVPPAHSMAGRYGWVLSIPVVAKTSVHGCLLGSPQGARIDIFNALMASNQHIACFSPGARIDIFIPFC
jgi:hypothetical protein